MMLDSLPMHEKEKSQQYDDDDFDLLAAANVDTSPIPTLDIRVILVLNHNNDSRW